MHWQFFDFNHVITLFCRYLMRGIHATYYIVKTVCVYKLQLRLCANYFFYCDFFFFRWCRSGSFSSCRIGTESSFNGSLNNRKCHHCSKRYSVNIGFVNLIIRVDVLIHSHDKNNHYLDHRLNDQVI